MNSTPDAPELPLREALRIFVGAATPVSMEIDTRGHTWCEAYLDQALVTARAALAASQHEPVALGVLTMPTAPEAIQLIADAWNNLDPEHRIAIEYSGLFNRIAEAADAQPPADLKDAQRLDFLESLLNRTEFQNSKRPAEPVSADMHFHGDAGCSLYIRDLFGNVVRCGSAGTVRSTIDAAMLSSAPTGEKP